MRRAWRVSLHEETVLGFDRAVGRCDRVACVAADRAEKRAARRTFESASAIGSEFFCAAPLNRVAHSRDRDRLIAAVVERRFDQERAIVSVERVARFHGELVLEELVTARFDERRSVGENARVDRFVNALPREGADVRDDLTDLVFARFRIRSVDQISAAHAEARTRTKLIDDERDLVVLEHEIAGSSRGVRSAELLTRAHGVNARRAFRRARVARIEPVNPCATFCSVRVHVNQRRIFFGRPTRAERAGREREKKIFFHFQRRRNRASA